MTWLAANWPWLAGIAWTAFDRSIVGCSKRICVPLEDRYLLRYAAEMLRACGDRLDILSRYNDRSERTILVEASVEIMSCNQKIRDRWSATKSGRRD